MSTKKKKPKGNTTNRRGHWPAGKRRNADVGDWSRIRIGIAALLNEHYRQGVVSGCALAKTLGVSEKSVRRWLDGTDRPAPEHQETCRQWLTERRKEIAAASTVKAARSKTSRSKSGST